MMIRLAVSLLLVTACVDETNLGNQRTVPFDPTVRWAISYHPLEDQALTAIAMGSSGDVVTVSRTNGYGPIASFIATRAASDGSERWVLRLPAQDAPGNTVEIVALATDANDNIVVAGSYRGTVDFGGQQLTRGDGTDTFVAVYTPAGALRWARGLSTSAFSYARTLEIGDDGTIYVGGSFRTASITLAGQSHAPAAPDNDPLTVEDSFSFVLALDANGTDVWGLSFDAALDDIAFAIDGDVLLTGSLYRPVSVGGPTLTPAGYSDVFVSRFRPDGSYVTSRTLGHANRQAAGQTLVQADGSIVVRTYGVPDTDPNTLVALDDSLNHLWTEKTKFSAFTRDEYSAVGARMTGFADDKNSWWTTPFEIARIGDHGVEPSVSLGEVIEDSPRASAVNHAATHPSGALLFGGGLSGSFDFGTGPVTGDGDILLLVVDPVPNATSDPVFTAK